eukprot:g43789.t1
MSRKNSLAPRSSLTGLMKRNSNADSEKGSPEASDDDDDDGDNTRGRAALLDMGENKGHNPSVISVSKSGLEETGPRGSVTASGSSTAYDLPSVAGPESELSLLTGLVENQHWRPAIKAVYDRKLEGKFQGFLQSNIAEKDAHIKNICGDYYEEFIASIDSLLSVKVDINSLKSQVTEMNEELQKTGVELVECAQQLMLARAVRHNINRTIKVFSEVFSEVQYVMSLLGKASEQIGKKKYIAALKAFDQLQRIHLPRFERFEFSQKLLNIIPRLQLGIQQTVTTDFKEWLSLVPGAAKRLGGMAMKEAAMRMEEDDENKRQARLGNKGVIKKKKKGAKQTRGTSSDDHVWEPEAAMAEIGFFLGPLRQCIYVFQALGSGDEFITFFKEKSMDQLMKLIELPPLPQPKPDFMTQTPPTLKNAVTAAHFLAQYTGYLEGIGGYFIIQDAAFKSASEIMPRGDLEDMWELAIGKIKVVLHEQLNHLETAAPLLQVKHQVVVFCEAMAVYQLPSSPLLDVFYAVLDRFDELILAELKVDVKRLFAEEKYEPLTCGDYEEYKNFVLAYGLEDPSAHREFPTTMPFSRIVPDIVKRMKGFVLDFFKFSDRLPKRLQGFVAATVDKAIEQAINNQLTHLLDNSSNMHISQAVQLSINANYLAQSCTFLEQLIGQHTDIAHGELDRSKKKLLDNMHRCEDMLFELVDLKIDAFMSLNTIIQWAPNTYSPGASEQTENLVMYLETTFSVMQHMTEAVREALHFTACKHISSAFLESWQNVKKFNRIGVWQLDQDLQALESFAQRCPIENLVEVFAELRQLINLFLSDHPDAILNETTRSTVYPFVSAAKLKTLVGRYKETGMMSRLPPGLGPLRKKQLEQIVKQLETRSSS